MDVIRGSGEIEEVGGEIVEVGGEIIEAGGEIIEAGGEIIEVGGEIIEAGGAIVEAGGAIMEVGTAMYWDMMRMNGIITHAEWVGKVDPKGIFTRYSRLKPTTGLTRLSSAAGWFLGAGITVLTMTDCNTVNGIIAIARMKEGGLLNVYEDRMMRELLYHKR